MKNKIFTALFALLVSATMICCKKDNSMDTVADCSNAAEIISESATEYSQDPSVENCRNYIDAIRLYVNSDCFGVLNSDLYKATLESLEAACE